MLVNIWLLNITSAALIIIFYKFYWRKCTKNKKDVKTVLLISTSKKLTKVSIQVKSKVGSNIPDELSIFKSEPSSVADIQKSKQNYELTIGILDLLIERSPGLVEELLIVKKAFRKWYQHTRQADISRNSEMLKFREKVTIAVKEEFKIVLEEIAYYLRSITEQYKDKNIERYYAKYLSALKKFHWTLSPKGLQKTEGKGTQTELDCPSVEMIPNFPTHRSLERQSLSTIESPSKRFKEVDIHRYIETKEQNLELQRKCDRYTSAIAEMEEQNMKLRAQLGKVLKENGELNENTKKHIKDIEKLSELLERLKQQESLRKAKEEKIKNTLTMTENKYQRLDQLKDNLHRELEQAEEAILSKERESNEYNIQEFFEETFEVRNQSEPYFKTQRKTNLIKQTQPVNHDYHRILLLQAKVLQEFISDEEAEQSEGDL